jgi:tetratricopeptide (TPR) repeat protein
MKPTLYALVLLLIAAWGIPAPVLAQAPDRVGEGIRLFEAGQHVEARALLEEAQRATPGDPRAAYYLGRIAYAAQDWGKASDWFGRAVKQDEDNANYHLWLGRAYGAEAQRANVVRQAVLARRTRGAFERSVALDPSNPEAHYDLMTFYLVAPGAVGGSKEKARAAAEEVRQRSAWLGFQAWASIYQRSDEMTAAEKELRAGLTAFPDSALPYMWLGSLYQQPAEYARASEIYEELLSRKPEHTGARYQVGRIAAVSGERLERGEEALRQYLDLAGPEDPMRVGAHWRLGMINERQGRIDLARQQYEAALAVDPKHKESKEALKKLPRS